VAIDKEETHPANHSFGWVEPTAGEIDSVLESLPNPTISETELMGGGDIPENSHLWQLTEKVTGKPLPPLSQGTIGSCVAHGAANAFHVLAGVEIANGDPEIWTRVSPSYIYGVSRVLIGGNGKRSPYSGDGSQANWAARGMKEFGLVAESTSGPYSENQCRQWGAQGPPPGLVQEGKLHLIRGISQVRNIQEAYRALANGFPILIANNVGFTQKRDAEGFCTPHGRWSHCMAAIGYRGHTSRRPGILIANSWGPNSATGPTPDMPSGACFYVDEDPFDGYLKSGDCWAISGADGFKRKTLDFSGLNCG